MPILALPALALLVLPLLSAPARAATESYGPWILSCAADPMTDHTACRMTHATPVEPATATESALALEVAVRRGVLVPVVTARDLGMEGVARGLLALAGTVQLRFPPNPMMEMPCGLEGRSVVCAPRPEDAARAAAELPQASHALLRVMGLGSATADSAPRDLPLSETGRALAAFRAAAPPSQASEPPPPFDLRDMLMRLQRFFFSQFSQPQTQP
ncbi:hypothetical protein F0Q34_02270 [Pseudoroseomonas oryzae]|uniref:Invasion associated locus B family protein n=1 Tax=Teichococcus oryzae TaxID=1608942 RepID=A0A5B2TLC8_9PROT|nr:hypothetical protein F0Q34_02270 [Pseudoroseomonas oryzae]